MSEEKKKNKFHWYALIALIVAIAIIIVYILMW